MQPGGHFETLRTDDFSARLRRIIFQFVFIQWGTPKQIVSGRDPQWTSIVWKEVLEGLPITLLLSTSLDPQTNERIEQRKVLNETQRNWPDQLPFVVRSPGIQLIEECDDRLLSERTGKDHTYLRRLSQDGHGGPKVLWLLRIGPGDSANATCP
ncbi:BQ2448_338 [Microbotryum intermedium]|uniref:BQ2448_338 protein n=1 Tax=Microbotryum intermedium TaxID=269621 RepID=A0A238F5B2_9BASI|nr:BQ2448_338 [Microbotryum intermedium]